MSQPASSATVLARPSANPVSRARRWRLAVERLSIYMPAALMAMLALGDTETPLAAFRYLPQVQVNAQTPGNSSGFAPLHPQGACAGSPRLR